MGLRDRDYTQSDYNDKKRRKRRTNGRSVVGMFISINVVLWFANGLLFAGNSLTDSLLLRAGDIGNPTLYWRFLTYGFVHSYQDFWHILLNMLMLLMFGYGMMLGIGPGGFGFIRGENVEGRLGRLEFAAFYLLTIIVGGIVYALVNSNVPQARVLGASGGVSGVVILYAWLYPKKMLLFMGVLPMPMWCIGLIIVGMDAMGAAGRGFGNIAYSVHLAGAACGTLYYFLFLKGEKTLTGWLESSPSSDDLKRKTKLRIHTPEEPSLDSPSDDEFNRLLDDVLKRYGEVGEAGLTPEEREFLQRASRRFAEKHRKPGE